MHAWSADGKRVIEVDDVNEKRSDVEEWEETECQICGTMATMEMENGLYVCSHCKCVQDNKIKL
tara:strand:+ start:349 stop:540 length:192 start_codon:yes stop_codon:yes gene_type:complete